MIQALVHQYLRKKVYMLIAVLNVITSLLRLFFFPGQTWFFHVSLFFFTFLVIALFWELTLMLDRSLEKLLPLETRPQLRIGVQILLTYGLLFLIITFFFGFAERYFDVESPGSLHAVTPVFMLMTAIIFNLVLFGVYYFYRWKDNLLSKINLEKEQAVVKYDALRNQLNPHFLFNALTSLNSLIFENQQLASDFLQQLSKVYRYILQHKDKETVSVRTELDFVQHYLFLLKIRFDEAIDIQIAVREQDLDKGVVPVLSQMLIENAVKHNILSSAHPLKISITSHADYLVVANNKIRKVQVETSNKLGMENLKALYRYLSEQPVEIEDTETQFIVRVPLI